MLVRGEKLLTQCDGAAHTHADEHLKKLKVNIHYKTPYSETLKAEKGFDLVINCTGQKYKADFLKNNFGASIASNGQIFVNDHY